jgi:MOSC domain-containing protein YiiM
MLAARAWHATVPKMRVRHLYISAGHNFFGHHQTSPGQYPMIEMSEIQCVEGRGISGDRFFNFKGNYKGQITFFSWEVYEQAIEDLEVFGKSPAAFRRNVITQGVDLNSLIGTEFDVQGVRFCGAEECRPCYWMDDAFCPGAEQYLKGRGGLRARILTSGYLRCNVAGLVQV